MLDVKDGSAKSFRLKTPVKKHQRQGKGISEGMHNNKRNKILNNRQRKKNEERSSYHFHKARSIFGAKLGLSNMHELRHSLQSGSAVAKFAGVELDR